MGFRSVSDSQGLRVSEFHSLRVSESQSSTVSESQSSTVSERQKAKVRKRPKSRKKTRFRLKTSQGRARSCENGAFGTEIVRGILGEKNLGLKPPKKRKLPKSLNKKIRFRSKMSQGWARSCENGAFGTEIVRGIRGKKILDLKPPKKRKLQNPKFSIFLMFSQIFLIHPISRSTASGGLVLLLPLFPPPSSLLPRPPQAEEM